MPHFTLEYEGTDFILSLSTMAGTVLFKFGSAEDAFTFLQALTLGVEIAG